MGRKGKGRGETEEGIRLDGGREGGEIRGLRGVKRWAKKIGGLEDERVRVCG